MKIHRIFNGALNALLVASLVGVAIPAFADAPETVGHPFGLGQVTAKLATARKAAVVTAAAAPSATMSLPNPIAQIQAFTVADVNAAIADATSHNDTRHLPCWQAILPVVSSTQAAIHLPTTLGLAELAQTYFDAKSGLSQPIIPDSVVTACALTMADLQMGVLQLGALVGLKIAPLALPAGL
jgi:hypothetical protein